MTSAGGIEEIIVEGTLDVTTTLTEAADAYAQAVQTVWRHLGPDAPGVIWYESGYPVKTGSGKGPVEGKYRFFSDPRLADKFARRNQFGMPAV